MRYGKSILVDFEVYKVNVYSYFGDFVKESFCFFDDESRYNCMECIQKECLRCGVKEIQFFLEEILDEGEVVWKRYEYVEIGKIGFNGRE